MPAVAPLRSVAPLKDLYGIGEIPPLGHIPEKMHAWVIRQERLDDYKVNWIILKPAEPLVKAIARSSGWDRVYADQYAVVFVRRPS